MTEQLHVEGVFRAELAARDIDAGFGLRLETLNWIAWPEIHRLTADREDHRCAIVAKTKTGHAIRRSRRRPRQLKALDEFIAEAQLKNDLAEWRSGRAVRAYIDGRPVIAIAADCGVTRWSVNR